MAERVVIAELDINAEAFIKNTAEIKKQIDQLKKDQKELTKIGGTSSKAFVQNAADLKVLSQAYNANIKTLSQNTKATADAIAREQLLSGALLEEVSSIQEARNQNKLLNKLRNETNVTTEQGRKELKALNDALDSNNEFIKDNADSYLKQKINIGNYKDSIKEAFNELNIFNGGLSGFIVRSQEAGGAGNLLQSSLKGAATGFLGLVKASLAFIATPIGAILAALVASFALVKNALDRSEESTNKLKLAFSAVTGIFNTVLKALEPLGEFLIDGIVMGFDLASKAAESAINIISTGLSFLGFDDAADSVQGWKNEIKEGVKAAQDLEKAEQNLEKSQRKARLTQLEFQKDAEKLRQIRDDEALSISERASANEQLGKLLQTQLAAELRIAEQALIVANLRIEAEGQTSAALDSQAQALTEIADIQERITSQESEQLANLNGLRRDAASQAKEIADGLIQRQEEELNLFIQQQGSRAKTLKENLKISEEVYRRETEILKAELKNRNISETEFNARSLELQNELAKQRSEVIVEEAQKELDAFVLNTQSKIDNEQFFSDESLRIEQERLSALAEQRRAFEQTRLEQGIINQTEFNDAINTINEENRVRNDEALVLREEAKKEKEVLDLENKRILDEENFQSQLEIDLARLEAKRIQEVEAAEKTGADIDLINQKFANSKIELEDAANEAKVEGAESVLNTVTNVLGRESAVGKFTALAQAGINVQQGITKAIAQGGIAGIATGAIVAAKGAASVAKIAGIDTKFEKGGIASIDGNSHAQGGVPVFAGNKYIGEAEGGEGIGILNRGAYASFMDFNNSFGSGQSKAGFYEGGGIITRTIPSADSSNTELLQAIQSMPSPIVTVQDIRRENSSYVQIESGANV